MTGWVEKDAERGARLVLGTGGTELEHGLLSSIEVVDHDVHVHLLGHVLPRPLRRPELIHTLEADALVTCLVANLTPPVVRTRLPIEQGAVELSETTGVVAVEDERGKSCDSHACQGTRGCGQVRAGIPKPFGRLRRRLRTSQPADCLSLMRSSTALGMVVSKSSSLAHVGVMVITTMSSYRACTPATQSEYCSSVITFRPACR